jgi:hypothetical protein
LQAAQTLLTMARGAPDHRFDELMAARLECFRVRGGQVRPVVEIDL